MEIRKVFNKISRFIVFFFLLLVIAYFGMKFYVDSQLEKRSYSNAYNSCNKIWATRGLVINGDPGDATQGNSIESMQLAFATGASGSEIDLFFDPELKQFIISHDYPYNLRNGELLTLEKLLKNIPGQNYLWLDFKKLRHLSDKSVVDAVNRLESITKVFDWKRRIYIEGADPINLGAFRDAGFKTLFDVHPLPDSKPLTSFVITIYKAGFYFGGFDVMGMKHGELDDVIYGPDAKKHLGNIPMFIYHIPNEDNLVNELLASQDVRVMIMQDHTLNRYADSACPKSK